MVSKELEKKKGLVKSFAIGFGCCLIPIPVIKKIKVKYSENNFKPDNAFFYQDLERLNIPVYADVDLIKKISRFQEVTPQTAMDFLVGVLKRKKNNIKNV